VGRLLGFGPRGKKEKRKDRLGWAGLGWKEGMGEGLDLFCFFSNPFLLFPFQILTQNFLKKF
jgi:hypothetical protein